MTASFSILAVAFLLGFVHGSPQFDSFIAEHARTYRKGSPAYEQRRALFEERVEAVEKHNSNPNRLWSAGVNKLTDWTEDELRSLRGWRGVAARGRSDFRGSLVRQHRSNSKQKSDFWPLSYFSSSGLPASVSWAHLNSTRTARDQGPCGSCWAYATAVAMEAVHEHKRGFHLAFSPDELVQCSANPHHCGGEGGCHGSTAEMAMLYVAEQGLSSSGVSSCAGQQFFLQQQGDDRDWESILSPGIHPVPESSPARAFGLVAWERLPENKAVPLMRALVDQGPVAVSVAANFWGMYHSGIFDNCEANATINHAVTMIGYGVSMLGYGTKFWHIQNSWGTEWGEDGYIKIIRRDSDDSDCGVDFHPEEGTGCDGGDLQVTVCGECGILYDSVVPHFE